ncbi:hypothetical protein E2F46_15285 [Luteimonas aestuarii]|uniref:Uncharacterized protein n=1 Tax=Luteimonas aestuarii TaxID=453837 RepID=A0A4R5TRQ9_9GAMM|nr:hypothetical protein [Luteimonas aestuarii]TDK21061.1 hypothetical protein E2F46_15285 [Luteimonas aestuarii]
MLKDLVDAGGSGLLVPAVLFVLVLYVIRGAFSLHGRKSQHRKEFLDLWDADRIGDDLWLEVTVRHLFGVYLPAHVIRLALSHPSSSQALLDLSELWPLLRYDASSRTVQWRSKRHRSLSSKKLARYVPLVWYFAFAILGVMSALIAYHSDQNALLRWTYSVLSIVLFGCAMTHVAKDDAIKLAAESGDVWIYRINAEAVVLDGC